MGVPEDVADRIFEPFFTTKTKGSGLGLPTVHRIVENHGGSMRLEAREGGGVRVRLRLPRAEGPA
jgi:signal transduction histidine kinase